MQYLGHDSNGLGAEHPALHAAAARGVRELRELPGNLVPGPEGAVWAHHIEYADRALALADHIEEALASAGRDRLASSSPW